MSKIKFKLDKKGLDGDNLKFIESLEKRIELIDEESLDKDVLVKEVKSAFKGMFTENGELSINLKKLEELLGEDEKGIMAIVKKHGEALTALKEGGKNGKETKSFKVLLNEKMAEVEKLMKTKEGGISLSLKAPATMTLANTIEGDDLLPDELIESFSIGQFVGKRQPREYVFDMANRRTVAEVAQFKTWLEEGDEEGAFAIVAEGGLKPLVSMNLVRNDSRVAKVAAKYVVTEEFAKFRKEAYSIIQRLIQQKITRDYAAILTTRLLADASPYTASALDGQYANPTDYHAIAAVAAQIESLNFMPDLLIMNPQDKWRIGMLQDLQGQFYLTIPTTDPTGNTRMMGFTVRTSNRIPVGEFILGESGLWEIEDEAISVRMGYGVTVTGGTSNGGGNVTDVQGDLDHNRMRVIVETYFHSYIATNNLGSFVHADFDVVKALLETP